MFERQQAVHVDAAAVDNARDPKLFTLDMTRRPREKISSYHGRKAPIESRYDFRVRNSATIRETSLCSTSTA
jgi:hypothetical protein